MKLKALLFSSLVAGSLGLQAQIQFDPQIKVDHLTDTLMYPNAGTPLKYQIRLLMVILQVKQYPKVGTILSVLLQMRREKV
jgi:hypothetical protein